MATLIYGIGCVALFIMGFGIVGPTLIASGSVTSCIIGYLLFPVTFVLIIVLFKAWMKTVEGQTVINKIKESI